METNNKESKMRRAISAVVVVLLLVSSADAQMPIGNGYCTPGISGLPVSRITTNIITPRAWIFARNLGPVVRYGYLNVQLQVDQLCGSGWENVGPDRDAPGELLYPFLKTILESEDELYVEPWGADPYSLWRFKIEFRVNNIDAEGHTVAKTFYSDGVFIWCSEPEEI